MLYTPYSEVGRGYLVLRHSVLYNPLNLGDIVLYLVAEARKLQEFTPRVGIESKIVTYCQAVPK